MKMVQEVARGLNAYDGRDTSVLSDIHARYGGHADFRKALISLIGAREDALQDGATWLIKTCAESGDVPNADETAALLDQLDAVSSWQATLHLCQCAERFVFTHEQATRFGLWACHFLNHERAFLRAWAMSALCHAARQAPDLTARANGAVARAETDKSASVRARARKVQGKAR